ncbi:MAG: aminotransferase class V-fold PLP-dependent enzyme, partial [Beijerinckiaceae bacterium]|nr:aminotransferase class V-fold PLP-dependent enzyme [Beijerinckiaceae bacterium]
HHCAQPILRRFGLAATVRPSLALYNTKISTRWSRPCIVSKRRSPTGRGDIADEGGGLPVLRDWA